MSVQHHGHHCHHSDWELEIYRNACSKLQHQLTSMGCEDSSVVGYPTAMLPCAWRWWKSVYTVCANLSSLDMCMHEGIYRIWVVVAKADSVFSTRWFHNLKYSLLLIFVNNVTGCELLASCHPVKTMQNDVSGSVPEVIRHKVIVGSVHRCLFIILQQVLLIGSWQVVFNK